MDFALLSQIKRQRMKSFVGECSLGQFGHSLPGDRRSMAAGNSRTSGLLALANAATVDPAI